MSTKQENDVILGLMSDNPGTRSAALKLIYKDYFPRIESFVIKCKGDRFDAKDVFQEGVMTLYQNIKMNKFRGDSTLFTYIYSICRNVWYQRLQQPVMKITSNIDTNEVNFDYDQTEEINNQAEGNGTAHELIFENQQHEEVNIQTLGKIMAGLKEDCKKMLVGFYYESKSMEELSSIFDLGSAQAAKNKKSRCLSYLTRLISKKGLTYENFIG